jgi:hypothetical protein
MTMDQLMMGTKLVIYIRKPVYIRYSYIHTVDVVYIHAMLYVVLLRTKNIPRYSNPLSLGLL